ncbi:MAG TPA: tetratricopeptide repeat protein [Segetibacter sp.]|jgi:tetratricopeptide (TPR) repeat protein
MKKFLFLSLSSLITLSAFSTEHSKDSASFYLTKAINLKDSRKVWDAEKSFLKAIQFDPADANLRVEYGNHLVEQRKYFPAFEQFSKILEKNTNHLVALQKLTEISFTLRRWNDVIKYSAKVPTGTPKLNFMIGKSYYEIENYGQAEKFLTAEVAANPRSFDAVSLLGKVYIELSNYKHAIALYNKALNMDPNNNQMIYELGLLYYTMNNEKEAVKYFELAIAKGYKKDLDVMENIGLACLSFDIKKGVEILSQVMTMKPGNPEILFQIAQAYFKIAKFQDAADTFKKIYEADPSNTRALYMQGIAYIKNGDKNKGTSICEQAIRLDPALAQLKSVKSTM